MSPSDGERLADIVDAHAAISVPVARGALSDGLIFDAVRVRLIDIGKAIRAIPTTVPDSEPGTAWGTSHGCGSGSRTGTSTLSTATSPTP